MNEQSEPYVCMVEQYELYRMYKEFLFSITNFIKSKKRALIWLLVVKIDDINIYMVQYKYLMLIIISYASGTANLSRMFFMLQMQRRIETQCNCFPDWRKAG